MSVNRPLQSVDTSLFRQRQLANNSLSPQPETAYFRASHARAQIRAAGALGHPHHRVPHHVGRTLMSAATINSFPSFHSLNSPRGWALAIIVLVHLGFFWALSNGLSH